jgi:hypothetical protein
MSRRHDGNEKQDGDRESAHSAVVPRGRRSPTRTLARRRLFAEIAGRMPRRRRAVGPYVRYFDRAASRHWPHPLAGSTTNRVGCASMTYQPSGVVLRLAKQASTRIDPVDSALIRAGQAAWSRVRNAASLSFKDWHAIGRAIRIGRRLCMKATHSQKPQCSSSIAAAEAPAQRAAGTAYRTASGTRHSDGGRAEAQAAARAEGAADSR